MEASALQVPVGLSHQRSSLGIAVLRLRSDEQLIALLRDGHEEAFQVIHDRYRQRLFAYMRQMLPLRQDAEDALQDVFERAYASLRNGQRDLALRPWLYRIAHNRCIDQLRRPAPPPPEVMLHIGPPQGDPFLEADRRESLRRLMADVRRLPEHQRSALLMRELGGISYADVAQALGVTVPAVKSLLVRARLSLVQAGQARDTACEDIRAELVHAHEARMRVNAMARRHLRDCPGCREFRGHLRGVRRQLLALGPSLGTWGLVAKVIGGGGGTGSAAGGGAAAACGGSVASGVASGGGVAASAGVLTSGACHLATLVAATVVTAGGAVAIQHTISAPAHHARHHVSSPPAHTIPAAVAPVARPPVVAVTSTPTRAAAMAPSPVAAPAAPPATAPAAPAPVSAPAAHAARRALRAVMSLQALAPIPDPRAPAAAPPTSTGNGSSTPASTGAPDASLSSSATSGLNGSTDATAGTAGDPGAAQAGAGSQSGSSSSSSTGSGSSGSSSSTSGSSSSGSSSSGTDSSGGSGGSPGTGATGGSSPATGA